MRLLRKGYLPVSKMHKLYYELRGKKGGIPAVALHGGPGSRFRPYHFKNFTPNHCVLFFDQRGCGRSKPFGELRENTTHHLVEDIRTLMDHVGFTTAKIVGGSWGSTLALCFAIKHPTRVRKLVISGVYLGTRKENAEMIRIFELFSPRFYEEAKRPPSFSGKMTPAAVRQLHRLERSVADNQKTWEDVKAVTLKKTSWLEPHYLRNGCFLPRGYILKNAHKIAHIPIVIIQGQQDLVCPPMNAWTLAKRFKKKRFVLVPGGHMLPDFAKLQKKYL